MIESLASSSYINPRDHIVVRSAQISLGGVVLEVVTGANLTGLRIYGFHRPFMVADQPVDCLVRTHLVPVPDLEWGNAVFTSGGLWSLYRNADQYVMPFRSERTGPEPYQLATFNDDFSEGNLYIPPTDAGVQRFVAETVQVSVDPLSPPLDELIVINRLSRGGGIYVHACGVTDGQRAVAFCGVSGAGKSTMARLWKKQPVILQSDDRLILRSVGDSFWAWGTPWHGDARVSSPVSAPLEKLYFIVHGPENRITPLSPAEAARRLLVRCFPTYYDAPGMAFTLDFISRVCQTVPCAELSFVPDDRVVDLVYRDALGG